MRSGFNCFVTAKDLNQQHPGLSCAGLSRRQKECSKLLYGEGHLKKTELMTFRVIKTSQEPAQALDIGHSPETRVGLGGLPGFVSLTCRRFKHKATWFFTGRKRIGCSDQCLRATQRLKRREGDRVSCANDHIYRLHIDDLVLQEGGVGVRSLKVSRS